MKNQSKENPMDSIAKEQPRQVEDLLNRAQQSLNHITGVERRLRGAVERLVTGPGTEVLPEPRAEQAAGELAQLAEVIREFGVVVSKLSAHVSVLEET